MSENKSDLWQHKTTKEKIQVINIGINVITLIQENGSELLMTKSLFKNKYRRCSDSKTKMAKSPGGQPELSAKS